MYIGSSTVLGHVADHLVTDAGALLEGRGEGSMRMEVVRRKRHTDCKSATHSCLGSRQWRWVVLPLPSDYLMVWLADEEKSRQAALREVMWYVESLARAEVDT